MTLVQRVRILPLLVLVAFLALVVRAGEFAAGIEHAGVAYAQKEEVTAAPPAAAAEDKARKAAEDVAADLAKQLDKADAAKQGEDAGVETVKGAAAGTEESVIAPAQKPSEAAADLAAGESAPAADEKPAAKTDEVAGAEAEKSEPAATAEKPDGSDETAAGDKTEWKDAGDSDFNYSPVREELYKDLAARREALEEREKAMATREALLEAAERELDQKIREMTAVRNEIEGLMKQQSEEELQRIGSLVKIYEGMKPGDAARIFDTLDMDVLISVMARMSERKSGPILAEMSPERARAVTIMLAQQKQLPAIPPQ